MAVWGTDFHRARTMSARQSSQHLERTTPITENPGLLAQLLNLTTTAVWELNLYDANGGRQPSGLLKTAPLTNRVATLRPECGNSVPKYDGTSVKTRKPLRCHFRKKCAANSVRNTYDASSVLTSAGTPQRSVLRHQCGKDVSGWPVRCQCGTPPHQSLTMMPGVGKTSLCHENTAPVRSPHNGMTGAQQFGCKRRCQFGIIAKSATTAVWNELRWEFGT